MSITLPGGTALVTGAASGIGRAAAHAYAKAGVSGLVVADLRLDALDIVVEECKRLASNASFSVIAVEVDVSQESKVIAMVERTVEAFGGIDYAANNAGVATAETHNIVEASLQEWERVHSVNSTGVFLCIREEVKAMIKQQPKVLVEGRRPTRGAIVNVASIASLVGVPYAPTAYVASKHAAAGLTKSAAAAVGDQDIRINAICPGLVQTALTAAIEHSPEIQGLLARGIMHRLASPEEIADQIIWATSPLNSYMTGAMLVADGGFTAL